MALPERFVHSLRRTGVEMEIKKLRYSRSPWRLVTDEGKEVSTTCVKTGIFTPVCGDTRAEVERWVLDRFEWYATCAKHGLLPAIYSQNWREHFSNGDKP